MLTRVARRQYLEHCGASTKWNNLRPPPSRAPYLLMRPPMSAMRPGSGLARRSSMEHARSNASTNPFSEGDTHSHQGGQLHNVRQKVMQPPLPPEVLSAVDSLLTRTANEKITLDTIRASSTLSTLLSDREQVRKIAEYLASSQLPLRSHRFLSLAHKLGCRLKQNAYECVCFHLATSKHWDTLLSVVSLGLRHTERTTSRLLNWRARALVETQRYALLQGILEEFRKYKLLPTQRTFQVILSGHIRNCDLAKAKECLQAMEEAGFPVDASTHAIVATSHRSLGADAQVQSRALEALPVVPTTTATAIVNSLIQLRLDAHDITGALQLLALFNHDVVDIVSALTSLKTGITFDREASLNSTLLSDTYLSVRQTLVPNSATFSVLINYMATQSNLSGALQILQSMIMAGVEPKPGVVASLVHAYFSAGRGNLAVRTIAEICDKKNTPFRLFKPLLSSPAADELPWVPSGMPPTISILNALLKGVLPTHGLNAAHVVLRIMHASNIKPNATTLEILISYLNKVERTSPRVLLRVVRKLLSPTLRPTLRHMHVILSCIIRHEKYLMYGKGWNIAAARFSPQYKEHPRRFPANRISGVADFFDPAAGIELPRSLSYQSLARPIMDSLSSRQAKSDAVAIGMRIRHDALMKSDIETAKEIFQTLLARGIHPNEYHFSALMEGLAQSGDLKGAVNAMRSAERAGIRPNIVMFTILIVGYARQGNPDLAMRVFQQMVTAGIKPDVPAIDAVSSAFFAVGAYTMARRVLISLWPHIQPFPTDLRGSSLKDLARTFRLLHEANRDVSMGLKKQQRLTLHWKLRDLTKTWQLQSGSPRRMVTRARRP